MQNFDEPHRRTGASRVVSIVLASLVILLLAGMIALVLITKEPSLLAESATAPAPTRNAATATPRTTSYRPIPTPLPGQTSPPVDLRDNPFVEIARDASPCVVGISNKISLEIDEQGTLEVFEQGSGSGVILSQDGYIVTNHHVIEGAEEVGVILGEGEECMAVVVGSDSTSDLAVLKIEKTGLSAARIGTSANTQVGEFAIVIGSPLGNELFGSVTLGIISAKNRVLDLNDSSRVELIQTDAAINPGNSGGGLYNTRGELIGINTIKYAYTRSGIAAEGLGFAIPIDNAIPIVNELIEFGSISRPVLGISLLMVDEYTARQLSLPVGVLVRQIFADSPAQKAGIRVGDVVTHIDGVKINVYADLKERLNALSFGDTVTLTVYREGGDTIEVPVVLDPYENPEN